MIPPLSPPSPAAAPAVTTLRTKAKALETAFLAEMLGHAGLGPAAHGFGGGAGEAQIDSFLREAQARAIVDRGGIGLAEHILRALAARAGDAG